MGESNENNKQRHSYASMKYECAAWLVKSAAVPSEAVALDKEEFDRRISPSYGIWKYE